MVMDRTAAVRKIFDAALRAVDPYGCVERHMNSLRAYYIKHAFRELYVAAFGKAAYPMARAVEDHLWDVLTGGIAVTKEGHGGKLDKIEIFEASHPLPDERGVEATERMMELLKGTDERALVLCLISGGGSALLVSPCEGVTLDDKRRTIDLLLKAGAEIGELNAVRKHISRVKGGRLAEAAAPSPLVSLIISDVIGDYIDVIASGPTAPDRSTFKDAVDVLEWYGLKRSVPSSVIDHLAAGLAGKVPETPKPGMELFEKVENRIIASNKLALEAARVKAEELGFAAEVISMDMAGEARAVAESMAMQAREVKKEGGGRPRCLISGGETTVTVRGMGKGGRNMELALAFARRIEGVDGITLLSAGTDGTDGPTDAAGAVVDGSTVPRAREAGLDAGAYLEDNDSYNFFRKAGGLLVTGPTGTNVMDIQVMIVE